jgi:cysteine-rich repeat protein
MTEGAETCDDGNTDNTDGCPADCIVDTCEQTNSPGGTLTVNISNNETGQTTFGVATVFIDYPEGKVLIPGFGGDSQVDGSITDRPTATGTTCFINDREHGVRFSCSNVSGFPEGLFFRIHHTDCNGVGAPALEEFGCQVVADETTDAVGNPVSTTCTLSYTP